MVKVEGNAIPWQLIVIVAMALLFGSLSACAKTGANENPFSNQYTKFFTGKEGVVMSYDHFPAKLYYYGPNDYNIFSLGVNLHNRGASFTRGGLYLSGYDPALLSIQEVPITGGAVGACGLSIGSIGFGELGGMLRCDGVQVSSGGGITTVRVDNFMQNLQDLLGRHDKTSWINPEKFDFSVNYADNPSGNQFTLNMNNMNMYVDYYQYGRLFIAWLAGINFRNNGGQEFLLAGDLPEFPGGEYAYIEYHGQVHDWPAGLDETTQHFLLTTCYQYTTFASPMVCIDPDPVSDNLKVCVPKSVTYGGGNGAPVSISSIEQENTPRKIIYRINVKNIGTGTVYDPGQLEKCNPYYPGRVTPQDLNVVYLGDVRVGNVGLKARGGNGGITCSPEVIRLDPKTKTGSTTCTYPIEYVTARSAYVTPLVVELWYGYSETLKRQTLIRRIT